MNKEDLKRIENNPEFIERIYNYCDRWCDRCSFTSNCFLFATEKQQFDDSASRDITNQKFWNRMEDLFKITFELLEEAAEDLGVDLNNFDTKEVHREEKRIQAKNHPAAQAAQDYITKTGKWFKESESLFNEKYEEFIKLTDLNLHEKKVSERATKIRGFVEVIRWYQHQIFVKIMRALQGKSNDILPVEDPIQNDQNGSAKVALIGIDRSIASWGGLLKVFRGKQDDIFPILVLLEKIRKHLENEFPSARKFQRPGFDD